MTTSPTSAPASIEEAGATITREEIDVTKEKRPATHSWGWGEQIRALRLYMGLSQRDLAARTGKDRRDFQRIENGQDKCPPGLVSQIEELADAFAYQVERVIEDAEKQTDGPLELAVSIDGSQGSEWDRLVAGRAYVETPADAPIILSIIDTQERSA